MSSHPGEGSGAPLPHLEEYIYIYITPVRGEGYFTTLVEDLPGGLGWGYIWYSSIG